MFSFSCVRIASCVRAFYFGNLLSRELSDPLPQRVVMLEELSQARLRHAARCSG